MSVYVQSGTGSCDVFTDGAGRGGGGGGCKWSCQRLRPAGSPDSHAEDGDIVDEQDLAGRHGTKTDFLFFFLDRQHRSSTHTWVEQPRDGFVSV